MEQHVGVNTMHKPLKIKLTDLNPHLTCVICHGYFVNATTITECLHSFCRSCIVQYLESHKYCPICEVQIHKTKPLLNLRSDQTLQDIVYKLVPGLFQNEMQRRKSYYASNPSVVKPVDPEQSGEISERSYIYTSDEYISLSLEYYNASNNNNDSNPKLSKRYLRCPAAVSILHLQKLIRAKYGLSKEHKVEILYQNDSLCEHFTLIDVAYIYLWKRKGPLHLTYRIFETECRKKIKLTNDFQKCDIDVSAQSIDVVAKRSENENNQNQSNKVNNVNNIIKTECTNRKDDDVANSLCHNNNNVIVYDKSYDKENKNDRSESNLKSECTSDKEVHLQISETGIISVTTMAVTLQPPYNETVSTVLTTVTASITPTLTTDRTSCCVSSSVTTDSVIPAPSPSQSAPKQPSKLSLKPVGRNSNSKSNQSPIKSNDRKRKLDDISDATVSNPVKKSASQVPCSLANTIKSSQNLNTSTNITTTTSTAMLKPSKLSVTPSSKAAISTGFSPHPPPPPIPTPSTATEPSRNTVLKALKPAENTKPKSNSASPTKKSNILVYKTLRNPPKSWNPTVQFRSRTANSPTYSNYVEQKSSIPSTTSTTITTPNTSVGANLIKSKPNKFFKVRNNIPRYLGNPASGVKPMYQISCHQTPPADLKKKPVKEPVKTQSKPEPPVKSEPSLPNTNSAGLTQTQEPIKDVVKPNEATNVENLQSTSKAGQVEEKPPVKVGETKEVEPNEKQKPVESNNEKINVARNSLKVSLGNRSSPMTVSEMLQLRNSPKSVPVKPEGSESKEKVLSVKNDKNDSGEVVESEQKVDEIHDEKAVGEKVPELKISQTTVPIYSPRLKQKSESKFQKSALSLNLKIDVQNIDTPEISQAKYPFNNFSMPSPMLERKSPKQKSRNSPKPSTNNSMESNALLVSSPKKKSPSNNSMFESKTQLEQIMQNQHLKLSTSLGKYSVPITKSYVGLPKSSKSITPSDKLSSSLNQLSEKISKSLATTSSQLSPKLPKLPDLSLANQKFNLIPHHPFISLDHSQFFYSNYRAPLPQFDPRFGLGDMHSLAAYQNFSSIFLNQHRLNFPQNRGSTTTACNTGVTTTTSVSSSAIPTSSIATTTPSVAVATSTSSASSSTSRTTNKDDNSNDKK